MDGKRKHGGCSVLLLVLMVQITWSHGAVDTIKQGQSIRDGETLVSAGGVFELGFFSPGVTNNRYLGLWYKQISVQTVVWVANRGDPLTNTTGFLTITDGGNLVVEDPRLGIIHVLFIPPSQANSSGATLLDSGNFLLKNEVGEVVWQSFDYPTDTLLADMKLGFDRQTGRNRLLTSWTSPEDPASGSYSLVLDTNEGSQLIIRRRDGSIYWSSGLWNGEFFSLVPEMLALRQVNNFSFFVNQTMNYFIYSYDSSIPSRLLIGPDGNIMHQVWSKQMETWILFLALPSDECGLYNSCGANACCNISGPVACKCLEGFEDDLSRYQQSSLWQRRCVRRKNLTCGDGDEFLRIESVRFPDRSSYEGDTSLRQADCEYRCRSNCSCTGYASTYSNGSGGCLFWTGDLIDLRFSPPSDSGYDGNISTVNRSVGNFYVRVAAYDLVNNTNSGNATDNSRKKRWTHVLIAVMVPGILMFISCILCYLLWWRKHKRTGTNASARKKLVDPNNISDGRVRSHDLPFFSFAAVETATDNFSLANKLGQGGFGPVYKGKLADGREIAVKRLSRSSGQGLEEFKNEVMVISKLQHRNLVRLLGWCVHGEEKILIYEYMPHKSLDSFLFDQTKKSMLDWGKRIRVIEGIAQGLLYLHQYSRLTVIHRDLKASNILLDNTMNPKISEFGMARIFGGDQSQANTNRVVGTYGYMSPEYAMEGVFSVKSDVFSFGVLLLEIVSGKTNAAAHYFDGSLNLLGYAWKLWKDSRISELVDPMFVNSVPTHELSRYIQVALLCVQNNSIDRPIMSEVVHMLTNKTAPLVIPKQPAFSIQTAAEADALSRKPATCSVNDVTITEINEGR